MISVILTERTYNDLLKLLSVTGNRSIKEEVLRGSQQTIPTNDDLTDTDMARSMHGLPITLHAQQIHQLNKKWWVDLNTGLPVQRNFGECLMQITGELAEALEGHRKNEQDKHLPEFAAMEVEMADALIRLLDVARGFDLRIGRAFKEKLLYNLTRPDHSDEARKAPGGKKF